MTTPSYKIDKTQNKTQLFLLVVLNIGILFLCFNSLRSVSSEFQAHNENALWEFLLDDPDNKSFYTFNSLQESLWKILKVFLKELQRSRVYSSKPY